MRGERSQQTKKIHARHNGRGHSNEEGRQVEGVSGTERREGCTGGFLRWSPCRDHMHPSTLHPQPKAHLFQRRLHQRAQLAEDFFHLY